MAYDYTVLAGTQGGQNHRKTDRMVEVAEHGRMPMVLFAEGGGGRPGDTDGVGVSTQTTFARFAQLSGLVPMVGITSGGAVLPAMRHCSGVAMWIIALRDRTSAWRTCDIEGGGLASMHRKKSVHCPQVANGVVDVALPMKPAQCALRSSICYFQADTRRGPARSAHDAAYRAGELAARLQHPRRRETLADTDSVSSCAPIGAGMVTPLVRVEGRLSASSRTIRCISAAQLIDAADKGARFMQFCDALDIRFCISAIHPASVGPEIENRVGPAPSRMFVIGANLSVPFTIIGANRMVSVPLRCRWF